MEWVCDGLCRNVLSCAECFGSDITVIINGKGCACVVIAIDRNVRCIACCPERTVCAINIDRFIQRNDIALCTACTVADAEGTGIFRQTYFIGADVIGSRGIAVDFCFDKADTVCFHRAGIADRGCGVIIAVEHDIGVCQRSLDSDIVIIGVVVIVSA